MATISVGSFVPIPGQTVYLTDKASTRIGTRPVRLLITEESKPAADEAHRTGAAAGDNWLSISGDELGPCGERLRHRELVVYAPAIVICGDPGVRQTA